MNKPDTIATLFYRNKYLLHLAIVIIIIAGLTGYFSLPKTEDPELTNRIAIITTSYPGADAERVEALVTEPIETRMRELDEIKSVDSNSLPGISVVMLEFKDDVYDAEPVLAKARNYLNDVRPNLPEGTLPSFFDDQRFYAYTAMYTLVPDKVSDIVIAKRYADELANLIRNVSGTDFVKIFGEPEEEITVAIEPNILANLGLTVQQLADRITKSDTKMPAGTVYSKDNHIVFEVSGNFKVIDRVKNLPIASNLQSQIVRLDDIATITQGYFKPQRNIMLYDNKQGVLVATRMLPNTLINNWHKKLSDVTKNFAKDLPSNIKLIKIFDQKKYIDERLGGLRTSLLLSLLLVLTALFLTLGWRLSLILSFTLPLSILFAIACLRFIDLGIQQMTVVGMIVAIGIMIDNAIVISEMIQHKLIIGIKRMDALMQTIHHLWLPLLAATVTTIIAFLPFILLPGAIGEFVGGVSYSVIFTLIGSYIISHTIIASIVAQFAKKGHESKKSWLNNGITIPGLSNFYHKSLSWLMNRPYLAISGIVLLVCIGFGSKFLVTEQFFPAADRDQYTIDIRLKPSTSIEQTLKLTREVNNYLSTIPDIKQVTWLVGRSVPPFYYNALEKEEDTPNYAQGLVTAVNYKAAYKQVPILQKYFDEKYPNALILVTKVNQGPPFNAPIEIRIYGNDLSTLHYLGDQVRLKLLNLKDIIHTRTTLADSSLKVVFELNDDVVQSIGLDPATVANSMSNYLEGGTAGILLQMTEELPVRIRTIFDERKDIGKLGGLPITSTQSTSDIYLGIPLDAIGNINLTPSWYRITRRNGFRVNIIEAYLADDVLPAKVVKDWNNLLKNDPILTGEQYRFELGGEHEGRTEAVSELLYTLPVLFLIFCSILILIFRSLIDFAIIAFIAVMSFSMGLLSLFISGYPFGFVVIASLLGLIGLAINAAIVILTEITSNQEAKFGNKEEIINSTNNTTRHIVSTTITTAVGFMPLIIAGGLFWPPFAATIIGGVILTTSLSLYAVPTLYFTLVNLRKKNNESIS